MKFFILFFGMFPPSLLAMETILPAMKRAAILQQRADVQKSPRWGQTKNTSSSHPLLEGYAWLVQLPSEVKEEILRLTFSAHEQVSTNQLNPENSELRVSACAFRQDSALVIAAFHDSTPDCNHVAIIDAPDRFTSIHGPLPGDVRSLVFDKSGTRLGFAIPGVYAGIMDWSDPRRFRTWVDGDAGSGTVLFSTVTEGQPIEALLYPINDGTELVYTDIRRGQEGGELARVQSAHGPVRALASLTDSNGAETIVSSHEHKLVIGSKVMRLPPIPDADARHQLTVSPCQRYCAIRRGSAVHVYNVSTEKITSAISPKEALVSNIVFHPSGASYLYACADGRVVQRSSQTRALIMLTQYVRDLHGHPILSAAIAPDLSKAFICYDKGSCYLQDLASYRTLANYFSQPRPYDQLLLVQLLSQYRHFINHDGMVRKNRLQRAGLSKFFARIHGRNHLPPINALLIDEFTEFLHGVAPDLTVEDMEKTRNALPIEAQRALARYFGLYVKRKNIA